MVEILRPDSDRQIPEETVKVAKAAIPNWNFYLILRDTFGPLFDDKTFRGLYPALGQPAKSPGRLALITIMQFLEDLSDRQAADAVRSRIDWKYILGLELDDPGFDFSVLSEFRQRLIEGKTETIRLEKLLERCEDLGLLKGKKKQRTDSTHVIAAVRGLSLLELVGEAMRRTLDEVAQLAPNWLKVQMKPEWVQRYARLKPPQLRFMIPKSRPTSKMIWLPRDVYLKFNWSMKATWRLIFCWTARTAALIWQTRSK